MKVQEWVNQLDCARMRIMVTIDKKDIAVLDLGEVLTALAGYYMHFHAGRMNFYAQSDKGLVRVIWSINTLYNDMEDYTDILLSRDFDLEDPVSNISKFIDSEINKRV